MKANQDAFYENERLEVRVAELEEALRLLAEAPQRLRDDGQVELAVWSFELERARKLLNAD